MKLRKSVVEKMYRHALETYPEECCGIVTCGEQNQTVHFCRNIQNRLHAEDPEGHPRDARTAYAIDRREMDRIIALAAKHRGKIMSFYHSHADHDSYFSEIDKEAQTVFGEPEFPDALQFVISVKDGEIKDLKGFKWDRQKKSFVPVAL